MLNKIKLGPKLIGGFLIVSAITAFVGILGITNMKKIDDADTLLYTQITVPMSQLIEIIAPFHQIRINLRDLIRTQDKAIMDQKLARIDELDKKMSTNLDMFKKNIISEEAKKMFDEIMSLDALYKTGRQNVINCAKENKDAEAWALMDGEMNVAAKKQQTLIESLVESKISIGKETAENNTKMYKSASLLLTVSLTIAVLFAIIIGISLTISITRPLARGVDMVTELSKGHLNKRLNMQSKDEIGILAQTMDSFADDLQSVVVATMQKIADGDVSADIKPKDNQDEINPALKKIIESLRGLIGEAGMLRNAAVEGQLSTRGDINKFKGAYREIVKGVNDTLDAVLTPINEAAKVLEKVAGRDMRSRVVTEYRGDHAKIKNSLNTAVETLDKALSQVAESAEQVSSASQQISAGSQTLSQGANEQASSLEEVSSSLEEMASMTKQNADNAIQAKNLANEANTNAAEGTESMKSMDKSINKIKESSDQTAKIVKTIDEIAMQTNLLALNAAVEAARAGEAGRGFAVVAEEVRNLAQRSAQAAKNTADMIAESVKNADEGVKIAVEVSKSFDAIVTSAKKVNDLIAEIAAASQEQSQGIEQVNNAVAQMDKVTQQNAANSEESASAAEELSSQSQELFNMVGQFELSVKSASGKGSGKHSLHFTGGNSRSKQERKTSVHEKSHSAIERRGIGNQSSHGAPRLGDGGSVATAHAAEVTPEDIIPFNDDKELENF